MNMKTEILDHGLAIEVVRGFSSEDYYDYGNIPSTKLDNAIQSYPVDRNDTPMALIDATVFGSAQNGMVVGLRGVYWNNGFSSAISKENFLSWQELGRSSSDVAAARSKVILKQGYEFDMAGSSMKPRILANLLNELRALWMRQNVSESISTADEIGGFLVNATGSESNVDEYGDIFVELLALCMAADGNVEDEEVKTAGSFLEFDEQIRDKQRAMDGLLRNIQEFSSMRQESKAILKLKAMSIGTKAEKKLDESQLERLIVVLEEMVNLAGSAGRAETESIVEVVMQKLR